MLSNTLSIVVISYAMMISILLLPQMKERKNEYLERIKILSISLIPILVSVYTVYCLENSCFYYAKVNAIIIMVWCVSIIYIYLFKKLI